MLVLEPIFEADLPQEQYAYRPGRNAQQAAQEVQERLHWGQTDVVDAIWPTTSAAFRTRNLWARWRDASSACSDLSCAGVDACLQDD
jgi:retron-type reverse transcriptase